MLYTSFTQLHVHLFSPLFAPQAGVKFNDQRSCLVNPNVHPLTPFPSACCGATIAAPITIRSSRSTVSGGKLEIACAVRSVWRRFSSFVIMLSSSRCLFVSSLLY
nr:MAG TPA: hypothetical protein [Caudoviricetes sp.]